MSKEKPEGFYPVPDCLKALKKRYQEHGFLLTNTKVKRLEKEWVLGRSMFLLHARLSMESGGWDTMSHTGHVKTHWLSIGRERVLVPGEDTMLTATFAIIGPLAVMVARMKGGA